MVSIPLKNIEQHMIESKKGKIQLHPHLKQNIIYTFIFKYVNIVCDKKKNLHQIVVNLLV